MSTTSPEPAHPDDGPGPEHRSRGRWIALWVTVSILVTATAFALGGLVRSPWDTASENAARTPTVTAVVTTRQFTDPVASATGSVAAGSTTSVTASATDDGAAVVTATPLSPGSAVTPGSTIVEISGRPVLALPLPFMLYRDLAPGDSGTDVRAVQQALADLGLYPGTPDGTYGPATAAAVRALYTAAGATAPAVSDDLTEAVETASSTVTEMQQEMTSAQRDRDRAQRALEQAQLEQTQAGSDATAADVVEATTTLEDADAALTTASTALAAAQEALTAAQSAADTPLPSGESAPTAADGCTLLSVADVGTILDGGGEGTATAAAELLSGTPTAQVRVTVADAEAFAVGAQVTVTSTKDASRTTAGTVSAVSAFSTSSTLGELPGYDVTIAFADPAGTALADAESVAVSPVDGGSTQEGLAAPLVALRSDGDRTYVLRVVDGTDETEQIEVTVETTSDGYALVASADLREDDVLVVDGAS